MTPTRWALVPVLAFVAALAIACSGDSDEEEATPTETIPVAPAIGGGSGAGSTAASGPTAVAEAPTAAPDPTQSPIATVEGTGGQLSSVSLEDLDSYRFDMTMMIDLGDSEGQSGEDAAAAALAMALFGNIQLEGAYVAPDRFQISTSLFGFDLESIQIGEQSWTNEGSGWTLDTAGSGATFDFGSPSDLPLDEIPLEQMASGLVGNETVNGVETIHYSFDEETFADFAAAAGDTTGLEDLDEIDQLQLDVWLTAEGVPVKMTMFLEGESEGSPISVSIEYNIKDVNDPSISIEAPI